MNSWMKKIEKVKNLGSQKKKIPLFVEKKNQNSIFIGNRISKF